MFYIQIVQGKDLQSKAIDQWTRDLPVAASRGLIVDRNGVVLADNSEVYAVYLRCRLLGDVDKTAEILAETLDMDENALKEKIRTHATSEITVKKKADKSAIAKLKEYDLPGVYFTTDSKRVYPYGDMLCQILGYTSVDGAGQSGLELRYDEYLKGYDGEILYESDLTGVDIDGKSARYIRATDGLNVRLTIDYEIQRICDAVTQAAYLEYSPKTAAIIVIDPSNGQILAVSENPSYDLNDVPRNDAELLNKASRCSLIVDSYEPGSTFKVLTAAANIEEYLNGNPKAFSLNYVFNSSRYRIVDGKKIKCWSNHANGKHSNENLAMALNNSCNPCFVDIGLSLGKEKMYEYIEKFGYGKTTGVDFNGETSGMLVPESAVKNGDIARISFGQTIAVTPLQLACATAAAVNGGTYYEPYFVKDIYDKNGRIAEIINPKAKRRVISEKASRILAGYLEGVVRDGSGKQAYIAGYKVGGKTGTAQKFENGVLSVGKNVMSFVGFFPANNPKYLALAIVDEPNGGRYGSTVAAPLVKKVFEGIIESKNIKAFEKVENEN
ncbi:MAG: penicillin-binding transpeptidase domain-containing protein [Eubacteriales bacterium]|nr:penicillin-binding transpeptidase domain-containing protein [Eubacteriales bacterium]